MDWYHWETRTTLDGAAWTGVPRSFLSLQPLRLRLRDIPIPRSDIWRLRRDLNHLYDVDDYSLEPLGPFCPFGSMEVKDIEPELHSHLQCCWVYKHWTWVHNSTTDPGFRPTGIPFDIPESLIEPLDPNPLYISKYSSYGDGKAIQALFRISSEWTFKWCAEQVERGFTGHVVPPTRYSEPPLGGNSENDDEFGGGEHSASLCERQSSTASSLRIQDWVASVQPWVEETVTDGKQETEQAYMVTCILKTPSR